jgi:hypothetical protein
MIAALVAKREGECSRIAVVPTKRGRILSARTSEQDSPQEQIEGDCQNSRKQASPAPRSLGGLIGADPSLETR